jgi:ribosomal protein S18 acetylase RimI-like enzyme
MTVRIERHTYGTSARDDQIADMLRTVFIGEGFSSADSRPYFEPGVLDSRGSTWVATVSGEVAGAVLLVTADNRFRQVAVHPEAEVHLLAVARAHRGLGIGDALLEALTAHARDLSIPALVLSSQPSMIAAHALYTKAGYTRAPGRDWTRSDRSFWVFEKRPT